MGCASQLDYAARRRHFPPASRTRTVHGSLPRSRGTFRGLHRLAPPAVVRRIGAARVAAGPGSGRRAGRPAGPAAPGAPPPGQAGRRVRRGVLARQVRAHQRDLLRGLRRAPPAFLGRAHDDVPDRAPVRRVASAVDPAPADRDAPEGRDGFRIQELRGRVGDVPARSRVRGKDGRGAVARVAGEARARRARAQVRPLRRRRGRHPARARERRRGQRRHPVLAARGDQLPASAAAAGTRDPRHAGPERDRHGAGAHAQPAAERARAALHPRGGRGRHQDRPRSLERPPLRRRRREQVRPHGDPQQDRRPVGRPEVRRRDRRRDRAAGAQHGADPLHPGLAGVRGVRAEGAAREGQRRRRAARAQPPARARALAVAEAHPGQARHRRRRFAGRGPLDRRGRARDPRRAPRRHRGAAGRADARCAARTRTSSGT